MSKGKDEAGFPGFNEIVQPFSRFAEIQEFSRLGKGSPGGKAHGLALLYCHLKNLDQKTCHENIRFFIPPLTVITTSFFDIFMEQNNLYEILSDNPEDELIAHYFMRSRLPAELTGDLRHLIARIRTPLAVRSSSLLEDARTSPFAGVYETKMIPNNQPETDVRFRHLTEAIKLVYASTFFRAAQNYRAATGFGNTDEKMAVIIQQVVGLEHNRRFYPNISGVARSYNFYPQGGSQPEEGVVNLALGLGKSIVDGGKVWTYCPAQPRANPPFGSTSEWLSDTQKEFWAINMSRPKTFNPLAETEFMIRLDLEDAEYDNTLTRIASTYDPGADRIQIGTSVPGPRLITFAPLLQIGTLPLNQAIMNVLHMGEEVTGTEIEMEFALTWQKNRKDPVRFGLLQVRPMSLFEEDVSIEPGEWDSPGMLVRSENALGNGSILSISSIIYIRPDNFDFQHSRQIARELSEFNREMAKTGESYLLIGFGRWGSSDPWLGIPVVWGDISAARAMVECTPQKAHVDHSQGSHFFHNLTSLKIPFLSVRFQNDPIDFKWLQTRQAVRETRFIRHIRTGHPLTVKVDGKNRRGVILR